MKAASIVALIVIAIIGTTVFADQESAPVPWVKTKLQGQDGILSYHGCDAAQPYRSILLTTPFL